MKVLLLVCLLGLPGCMESPVERKVVYISKSVQYSLDKALKKLDLGAIAFNEPSSMYYGETKTVELLLSPTKSGTELEGELRASGKPQHASVQIAPIMEAKLSASADVFDIIAITPETQAISGLGNTAWKWSVRAKKLGTHKLNVGLVAKLTVDKAEVSRSVQTFDHDIHVSVASPGSALMFAMDNWAVTTGIAGALLAAMTWLLRRRRPVGDTST